jgi:hypothetical protein
MIGWFKTQRRLRAELALLRKDHDELQDRHTKLIGRTLYIRSAPELKDLGDLWKTAEELGSIEVDRNRDYQRNVEHYTIKVKFKTKKNSSIEARGDGDSIVIAMENAINEARALMAGVVFADA